MNYQLRKKAREAKEAPSRHGGVAGGPENGCGKDASSSGSIPAVTANSSMDSTVDLSYSSDTMDTTGGSTSSAASADAAVEDDAKAAVSAADKQQQPAAVPSTTTISGGGGARTSTHIHVTTSSAFTRTGNWQRQKSAATAEVSTLGAQAQQKQQKCSGGKRLICLLSNGVADRTQAHRQLQALNILQVRQTPHEVVDGMDPAQRHIRDELFRISGVRGNYPQFFVERQVDNGYGGTKRSVEFWGNYETFENLNEVDSLPPKLLLAHPEVETWDNVFGDCY